MTDETILAILKKAFSILGEEEISNFEFHLRRETPVLVKEWVFEKDGVG